MTDRLSITVIIITRNRRVWLKQALESLELQCRTPDEVVVVDNASTDNTAEVVANFSPSLNIKYVFERRRGIPHARNTGVRQATSDIVAFLDDDCIADARWLYQLEIPFLRDPYVGAVGGLTDHMEVDHGLIESFYAENMTHRPSQHEGKTR